MIIAKTFDADKIKIAENSHKNTFICHIGYMTFKDPSYSKIISVNPYIDKINTCIAESNANKYFRLVPTDESKDLRKNTNNYGISQRFY